MAVSLTLTQRARSEEEAYKQTVECITGPISKLISTKGMPAVYEALDDHGKEVFKKVCHCYVAVHLAAKCVLCRRRFVTLTV